MNLDQHNLKKVYAGVLVGLRIERMQPVSHSIGSLDVNAMLLTTDKGSFLLTYPSEAAQHGLQVSVNASRCMQAIVTDIVKQHSHAAGMTKSIWRIRLNNDNAIQVCGTFISRRTYGSNRVASYNMELYSVLNP